MRWTCICLYLPCVWVDVSAVEVNESVTCEYGCMVIISDTFTWIGHCIISVNRSRQIIGKALYKCVSSSFSYIQSNTGSLSVRQSIMSKEFYSFHTFHPFTRQAGMPTALAAAVSIRTSAPGRLPTQCLTSEVKDSLLHVLCKRLSISSQIFSYLLLLIQLPTPPPYRWFKQHSFLAFCPYIENILQARFSLILHNIYLLSVGVIFSCRPVKVWTCKLTATSCCWALLPV